MSRLLHAYLYGAEIAAVLVVPLLVVALLAMGFSLAVEAWLDRRAARKRRL